ncbi:Gibberellin cluster GA4 desaturase [Colletotrichum viniferum]|nr:Gibberellin cluster GA4 desaturase [Colletotrichum viniferum]
MGSYEQTTPLKKQQVLGSFSYYDSSGIPALDSLTIIEGTSPDNKTYKVPVTNLRSLPSPLSSYTHVKHGFQIVRQPLPISPSSASVHNHKYMTNKYYPAMTELLRKTLGARCVVVRKHSIRDMPSWSEIGMNPEIGFSIESLAPFNIAHADHTPAGARAHFRAIKESNWFSENDTADEECTSPKERTEFFSVWRPFETVHRDPLAVMDMSLPVSKDVEFAPLTRTYRKRPGCVPFYYSQNAMVRPLDGGRRDSGFQDGENGEAREHAWRYLSGQSPEEVYLIIFHDSEALVRKEKGDDEIALLCPHSAFYISGTEKEPVRRSCELRVWCIW